MRRRKGFTLLEMLVVIIIIIILAGTTVALLNTFFRGQGARQGALVVTQEVARARHLAAKDLVMHYLVLSPPQTTAGIPDPEGWLEIHADQPDANQDYNRVYDGDQDRTTNDTDPVVSRALLPRFVVFDWGAATACAWISFRPSGYLTMFTSGGSPFPSGEAIQASAFDATMNGADPTAVGDIIVRVYEKSYRMCIDLDRASGKVRRHFFLAED